MTVGAARVRAVRRLHKRAFRAADGRFLAEGPQAVREALGDGGSAVEVYLLGEALGRPDRHPWAPELRRAAEQRGVPVQPVDAGVLAQLATTVTPQGVVAVCSRLDRPLDDALRRSPRLLAVLAHVRDPGNAGTVIRSADAAGADAVVLTDASVDVYNPKCVRATAGSLFHLPVVVGPPLAAVAAAAREAGMRVYAADGSGRADLDALDDAGRLATATAWVFGNEAWGLPPADRALADEVVRVPVHGRAESLNLATAAALCLYASARAQRRHTVP